jgi:hypothetical protein
VKNKLPHAIFEMITFFQRSKFSCKNALFSISKKAFAVCLAQQIPRVRAWSYN